MRKFNLVILKTIVYIIICYIAHKISDDFLSGGIAMAMCICVGNFIDKKSEED